MLTGDTAYDSPGAGFSLGGPGADVSGNTAYGDAYGISVGGPGSTVSGNTVFDNADAGINASGSVVVSGNTVYGQTGNATGIALSSGAQASGNVVYNNATGIDISSGGLVSDNQVYGNAGAGIAASSGVITIQGNHVYGNAVGVDLGAYFSGTVSNNVLEGNTAAGIHDHASPYGGVQELANNTIDAETGDAVQVDGGVTNAHLLNNILWAQAGYDIVVAADSQVGFQSDYNLFDTTGAGKLASWQGQDILTQPDWFYETGNDLHGQFGDPQFVNPAGADGVLGYSAAPVGSPITIDDSSSSGFALTGSWTQSTTGGYLGDFWTTPPGDANATASWTFTGLTPGATYEVAATWPGGTQFAFDAPYSVLEGGSVVGYQRVDQYNASAGISVGSTGFQVLGFFQVTGTSLTVMLSNNANNFVAADAVLLQQIVGDQRRRRRFPCAEPSPAVDAGDPASLYFQDRPPTAAGPTRATTAIPPRRPPARPNWCRCWPPPAWTRSRSANR